MTTAGNEMRALLVKVDAYMKDLGRGKNIFRLKAQNAVLLAVDMQDFVCRPESGRALPQIDKTIERLNLLVDFCHEHGIPVIWLKQCFTKKGESDDVGLYRRFHKQPLDPAMFNHEAACEIHAEMHLAPDRDFVVVKNRYSPLVPGSSRLASLLSGLGRHQLILGGAATNVCVESTARDAMQMGYEVTVLTDATCTFDKLLHQISLLNIKLFFGDTRTVAGVIRELQKSISPGLSHAD
jgi:ureidoacrylate peracid hydrolase